MFDIIMLKIGFKYLIIYFGYLTIYLLIKKKKTE